MGNSTSTTSTSSRNKSSSSNPASRRSKRSKENDNVASRASQVVGDSVREIQANIQSGIKKLEEQDHPAAQLLDTLCSPYLDPGDRYGSFYSEDVSDDSRTMSEDETTVSYRRSANTGGGTKNDDTRRMGTESFISHSDDFSASEVGTSGRRPRSSTTKRDAALEVNDEVVPAPSMHKKPLASSFAKRCYFTKAGIGGQTQHYEGLTLTGNVVLMLAAAMKLKGCPTICDEDLRRVEQTYPNQFSRLPDELLLSSGWRRISKYCHFSNKPIPDGMPFFHSKQRLHPTGGYYFLLAAAVGMVRPIDVEPLTRDTLVLLETDYPQACDTAPSVVIQDPNQWTLVDKFCFFSGGPINTDEDVYYQADFDGNPIYMLAFLSPSLTPAELYKLDSDPNDPALRSVDAVREVEAVYDLTERDFDDLKLYHLGPCRALPSYILQPQAWTKVLPPHFLAARQQAMLRAQSYEDRFNISHQDHNVASSQPQQSEHEYYDHYQPPLHNDVHHRHSSSSTSPVNTYQQHHQHQQLPQSEERNHHQHHRSLPQQVLDIANETVNANFQRDMEEDGAFVDPTVPIDEALAAHSAAVAEALHRQQQHKLRLDPPEDEPPSLSKRSSEQSEDMYFQYDHDHEENEEHDYYEPGDEEVGDDYYEEEPDNNEQYYVDQKNNGKRFANSPEESPLSGENDYVLPSETEDSEELPPHHQHYHQSRLEQLPVENNFRRDVLPPTSPRSQTSDSPFATTSAMRGAQELLRRNRQRRALQKSSMEEPGETENNNPALTSPRTDSESGATWESGSDCTGSSAWTENSNNPERSSRRALILQMARARMKNNRGDRTLVGGSSGGSGNLLSGGSGSQRGDVGVKHIPEEKKVDNQSPPQTKASLSSQQEDFDLTGDLD